METSAKHRHARISPQKCRLVADQVRGLPVDQALNLLNFSNKKAAVMLRKVLASSSYTRRCSVSIRMTLRQCYSTRRP